MDTSDFRILFSRDARFSSYRGIFLGLLGLSFAPERRLKTPANGLALTAFYLVT